ncbi:hypothetical protein NS2_02680 [Nocardia seriolae NBRC 15557]|nr:hypothetical protein NS2_02680 [Nocardia seriolae NBRC 15557]
MPSVLTSFFSACELMAQVVSADAIPVSSVVTLRPAETIAAALMIAAARRLRNIFFLQVSRRYAETDPDLPSAADDSEVVSTRGSSKQV